MLAMLSISIIMLGRKYLLCSTTWHLSMLSRYKMATAESAINEHEGAETRAGETQPPPETASSSGATSLLDVLKPAPKSDLARKSRIEKPKGSGDNKRKSAVSNATDPRNISPADRVKEFPNEVRHNCFVSHVAKNCH